MQQGDSLDSSGRARNVAALIQMGQRPNASAVQVASLSSCDEVADSVRDRSTWAKRGASGPKEPSVHARGEVTRLVQLYNISHQKATRPQPA